MISENIALLPLAKYHRLLQNIPIEAWQNGDIRIKVTTEKKRTTFELLRFSTELARVVTYFKKFALHVICLKGPVIGQKIYGSIGLRTFKDLDLLVEETRLSEATTLLQQLGYILDPSSEYDTQRANHLVFIHKHTHHMIELHWRLHPNILHEPTFSELWSRHEVVTIAGVDVPCLETEELFVYLISHGAKHAWFRLRWLYDIHLFLEQPLDFDRIKTRLAKRGCLHMMGQALLLRKELFAGAIPEEFLDLTENRRSQQMAMMARWIIEEQNDPGKDKQTLAEFSYWKHYHWLIRDDEKRREFVWHHLLPNQHDVATLRLPQRLSFLYGLLRPVTWSIRRFKQRKAGTKR
ncbi:nucleotidyltransferase family protein [Exiguobacterium sp. S90]|uniref:nucleotidyltransferase domain-containing protein n=1 Tax=Exiguobacterium sp. S90 TaxID=1221231 RepID=UPI001BE8B940